jgi:hypothetical protein
VAQGNISIKPKELLDPNEDLQVEHDRVIRLLRTIVNTGRVKIGKD